MKIKKKKWPKFRKLYLERRNCYLWWNQANLVNSLEWKRQKSDLEKLEKQLSQEEKKSQKFLKEIQSEEFEHPQAARYKLKAINKNWDCWK